MSELAYETLAVTQSGTAVIMTLDRPAARNAITIAMMEEMHAALLEAERSEACRAVVLAGDARSFSAGRDLKEVAEQTPADAERARKAWRRLTGAMEESPLPVLAAIEGHCLTGGLELAMACDLRIAGAGARFGITSAKLGSLPGFGGTQRLPRLVGRSQALDLLFSAEPIDAQEALRIGLINRLTREGEALDAALTMVKLYSTRAPLSLAALKLTVGRGLDMNLEAGLDFELSVGTNLAQTEDRKEGMRAFLEKRDPLFRKR